ncbi:DUF3857 domain-containing protein [Luteimonas sp. 8-5]|uniref:DUF3857 domain-containing protein n=1 Tax=Luteimonas sp. 8-5 TaxID=3039387 RepID=UPI002436981E|nr:DUF3857 domain-containing protein [Luteimonas sp. 8-5]MDG6348825.1 DUF3857 domain-containing protein [Luteimonas sp. 8-5]
MQKLLVSCALALAALLSVAGAGAEEFHNGGFAFSVEPVPGFVVERELPDTWTGRDEPDSKWRTWLSDRQSDRRQDRNVVYSDLAYQVLSPSLLGEAGRFQVMFKPEYQSLAFHRVQVRRDGAWIDRLDPSAISLARRESDFEDGITDGSVTALLVLPDLRVGDLVRIAWSLEGGNPILAGHEADWYRFDWVNPVLDASLRVLWDPGTRIEVHRENGAPEPVVRDTGDAVEVVLQSHDAPRVVNENQYPAWYQPFALAQVAPRRRWSEVVEWALPLYPRDAPLPAELERKAGEWARLPTPQARLAAALRLVQDEVRYFGQEIGDSSHRPAPPAITWERRYGDCKDKTYLLVTLLRRLGIEAVPALVSMKNGRAIESYVPSASDFDHVVVRALIDGVPVWVDATASLQGGDPRASDLTRYGAALPVEPGRKALQPIAAPQPSDRRVEAVQTFEPSATGTETSLVVRTTYRGVRANGIRSVLAHNTREELSRQFADYYRKLYGAVRVEAPLEVSDDREANVVVLVETYVLQQPFVRQGTGTRVIDLNAGALQGIAALPTAMSRKGPLQLGDAPLEFREQITLRLPEGWAVSASPQAVRVDSSPAVDYSLSVSRKDEAVELAYDLKLKQDFLESETVPGHLAAMREVRDSLNPRIVLSVPEALGVSERKRRLQELVRSVMHGDKEGDE